MPRRTALERAGRIAVRAAVVPGVDRALARAAGLALRPSRGDRLTATGAPGVRDLLRHAQMELSGDRVRAWAKTARHWPRGAEPFTPPDCPVLLLWADYDLVHPLAIAEAAAREHAHVQLRVLARTGFLIAYDDPVGLAREITGRSAVRTRSTPAPPG